ncbi:MAG: hypothetical protein ACU0BS_05310 [Hasllibacter sp.]
MRLPRFLLALALTAAPLGAGAQDWIGSVRSQLAGQGYRLEGVDRTLLGRYRIVASAPGLQREIVLTASGEVLRDVTRRTRGGGAALPGLPATGGGGGGTGPETGGTAGGTATGTAGGAGGGSGGGAPSGPSPGGGGGGDDDDEDDDDDDDDGGRDDDDDDDEDDDDDDEDDDDD